jgi:hypothetical protein
MDCHPQESHPVLGHVDGERDCCDGFDYGDGNYGLLENS